MKDLSIRVGGAAGDGIATLGEGFSRLFTRNGYHAYGHTAYQSVIRGGHVWFQARGSPDRIWSLGDGTDVLYALNHQTVEVHASSLRKGGVLLYDPEKFSVAPAEVPPGISILPVPTLSLARKFASEPLLQGSVGMGVGTYLTGLPFATLAGILTDNFERKGKEILDQNLGAAEAGYKYAQEKHPQLDCALSPKRGEPKVFMTGNEAIAMGAVAGGCKLVAQYPMTPASTVMHWMVNHSASLGVVVKQMEDELAAMNAVIGASHAGVRAMTASSGGGFALMVEALGMAGMTETPVVVVVAQRSGPSTGLPTKTEQGDLDLVLGAGQGDFPRAILAPGNIVEAYRQTVEAFQLSEDWQTPAILMSDFTLSEDFQSADRADFPMNFEVPSLFTVPSPANGSGYKRYAITPSGVSPRAIPGQKGLAYTAGSDEHDETGHLVSDVLVGTPAAIHVRKEMMEKRMRKLRGMVEATAPPHLEGPGSADVTIIAWGSTASPVRDAMTLLSDGSPSVNFLHVTHPFPLHAKEVAKTILQAKRPLLIEANFTGKLARLIRAETGLDIPNKFLKYDGEPFYPSEIVESVRAVAEGK